MHKRKEEAQLDTISQVGGNGKEDGDSRITNQVCTRFVAKTNI